MVTYRLWGLVALGFSLVSPPVLAQACQDVPADRSAQEALTWLEPLAESTPTAPEALEAWLDLIDTPLPLNSASAEALATLPLLDPLLAARIVRDRDRHGPFFRLCDLSRVEGLSPTLTRQLTPFLTVAPPAPSARRWSAQAWQRLQRPSSAGSSSWPRSLRSFSRLSATSQRWTLGLALEHDPAERIGWAPQRGHRGLDHTVAFVEAVPTPPLRLVAGTYRVSAGLGLALGRPFGGRKGGHPVSPFLPQRARLRGYQGASEHGYLQGGAVQMSLGAHLQGLVFASSRRLDATLAPHQTSATDDTRWYVRSLRTSGLHETPGEQAGRGILGATTVGGVLTTQSGAFSGGLIHYTTRYSIPFDPAHPTPWRYPLSSVYASAAFETWRLFGEVATDHRVTAFVGGGAVRTKHLDLLVLGRRYPEALRSPLGQPMADQQGPPANEHGLYLGLTLRLAAAWRMEGHLDQVRVPAPRPSHPRPTTGHDLRVRLTYAPRPWASAYVHITHQARDVQTTTGRVATTQPAHRHSVRLHGQIDLSRTWRLGVRAERVLATEGPASHQGHLIYQDIRWRHPRGWQIRVRQAFFGASAYPARLYMVEPSLYGTFSVPALHEDGTRLAVRIAGPLTPALHAEASYGHTRQSHAQDPAPTLGLQLRWRW
ncbi:MAG: helix-hairpin-helix domain-containing protein [Bacteroidota bacterium]